MASGSICVQNRNIAISHCLRVCNLSHLPRTLVSGDSSVVLGPNGVTGRMSHRGKQISRRTRTAATFARSPILASMVQIILVVSAAQSGAIVVCWKKVGRVIDAAEAGAFMLGGSRWGR
jgi:hypothetical protein